MNIEEELKKFDTEIQNIKMFLYNMYPIQWEAHCKDINNELDDYIYKRDRVVKENYEEPEKRLIFKIDKNGNWYKDE